MTDLKPYQLDPNGIDYHENPAVNPGHFHTGLGGNNDGSTIYVTPHGSDGNDGLSVGTAKATINGAQAALPFQNGKPVGQVQLGYGTITGASALRQDGNCIMTSTSMTVLDAAAEAGDVGAFVYGPAVLGVYGARIVSVVPGVSFTLDMLPGQSTTETLTIDQPMVVHYPSVAIRGVGVPGLLNNTLAPRSANKEQLPTQVVDTGNGNAWVFPCAGAAELLLGDESYGFLVEYLCLTGNSENVCGFTGSAQNYVHLRHVRSQYHGGWGCSIADPDNGASGAGGFSAYWVGEFFDCMWNGTVGATIPTGGMAQIGAGVTNFFWNCRFDVNYGFNTMFGGGMYLINCEIGVAEHSAYRLTGVDITGSGIYVIESADPYPSKIIGCWWEQNTGFDVVVASNVPINFDSCIFFGGTVNAVKTLNDSTAVVSLTNCFSQGHTSGWAIDNTAGATITWDGCTSFEENWLKQGNFLGTSAASKSVVGLITQPSFPSAVSLSSGAPWQNTTGSDVVLSVPLTFTANTDSATFIRSPIPVTVDPSFVQLVAAQSISSVTSPVTVDVAQNTTALHSLIVAIRMAGSPDGALLLSVTDTKSNVWAVDYSFPNSGPITVICRAFLTTALTTSDSITFHFSEGIEGAIEVLEFAGVWPGAIAVDASANKADESATSIAIGPTGETTNAKELALTVASTGEVQADLVTWTHPSGWTEAASGLNPGNTVDAAYKTLSSEGTLSGTWTQGSNTSITGVIITYKAGLPVAASLGTVQPAGASTDVREFYVPANWYLIPTLGGSASFTASATVQPV